jgi:Rrf2 family protein
VILRNQVEWALHCCTILAGIPAESFLATKDLAEFHGVPKEYLSKALQALSQAGIVEATLGPRGGYRLAHTASEINFLQIVEAIEGRKSTFACTEIRRNNPCKPAKSTFSAPCQIAHVMHKADEAWRDSLRATTLADIAQRLVKDLPQEVLLKNMKWLESKIS